MKKIAIFVEGETEYDFIKRLLIEVVGEENLKIIGHKMVGGNKKSGIACAMCLCFNVLYSEL